MTKIPRQQKVHTMYCRQGNMQGIFRTGFRYKLFIDQLLGSLFGSSIDLQNGQPGNSLLPSLGGLRITGFRFLDDENRDMDVKLLFRFFPPFSSDRLSGSRDNISARASRVIADRGCFAASCFPFAD